MWWVTVLFNAIEQPVRYSVVKSEYMPEFKFEHKDVYDGPFDTWADAMIIRDEATVAAELPIDVTN